MSDEQDAIDVDRVLAGDINAFEGIVRRWQNSIVTLAYRYFRDREKAEDMAQQAFVKAYQSLTKWSRSGTFGGWLIALATNLYRSEMRRPHLPNVPFDPARDMNLIHSNATADEELVREETVRLAVSKLPDKYRSAIILYYFHGMSVSQAAASLGIAEGTVKARLHRGRELLRQKLRRILYE